MANATYATDGTIGVGLLLTHQMPMHALGARIIGKNNSEFMYGYAPGAVAQGQVVNFDQSFNGVLATTANTKRGMQMGSALVPFAVGDFGWFQVRGVATRGLQVSASTLANTKMNTTTTAGQLGTDATAGSIQVDGPILATAQPATPGVNLSGNLIGFAAGASN